jgi:hypothetical protein
LLLAAVIWPRAAYGGEFDLPAGTPPLVRVAYLIPSNRSPQPDGQRNLQQLVRLFHAWYAEQMDRSGFGPMSFRYETEDDGITPRVHVVDVPQADVDLHANPWNSVNQAASDAGVPTWTAGQVWLLVPEMHVQAEDGTIAGGVALGAGTGSGTAPGVAMLAATKLSLCTPAGLVDTRPYAGLVLPGVGPYPIADEAFPWFEGSTVSSVVSSYMGAMVHEMSHGFGRGHDFRNDHNFHGNLMGNGLRGMRGSIFPELFPEDQTRLSYLAALMLSVNRYFAPSTLEPMWPEPPGTTASTGRPPAGKVPAHRDRRPPMPTRAGRGGVAGNDAPTVTLHTSGTVDPVDGLLVLEFTATDDQGLYSALVRRGGQLFGEMVLSGTEVTTSFAIPFFRPGVEDTFTVQVYDTESNRANASATITVPEGVNRAPHPWFTITPFVAEPGTELLLDASSSNDSEDGNASILYEWDLDGDGTFDTSPSSEPTAQISHAEAQIHLVRVRVRDPQEAVFASTPLGLRVAPPPCFGDADRNGRIDVDDLLMIILGWAGTDGHADLDRDGVVGPGDLELVLDGWGVCP